MASKDVSSSSSGIQSMPLDDRYRQAGCYVDDPNRLERYKEEIRRLKHYDEHHAQYEDILKSYESRRRGEKEGRKIEGRGGQPTGSAKHDNRGRPHDEPPHEPRSSGSFMDPFSGLLQECVSAAADLPRSPSDPFRRHPSEPAWEIDRRLHERVDQFGRPICIDYLPLDDRYDRRSPPPGHFDRRRSPPPGHFDRRPSHTDRNRIERWPSRERHQPEHGEYMRRSERFERQTPHGRYEPEHDDRVRGNERFNSWPQGRPPPPRPPPPPPAPAPAPRVVPPPRDLSRPWDPQPPLQQYGHSWPLDLNGSPSPVPQGNEHWDRHQSNKTHEREQDEDGTKDGSKKKLMPMARGDWICPDCGNLNFCTRKVCNRCPCLAPEGKGPPLARGDWICPDCGNVNYATRKVCNRCPCAAPPGQGPPSDAGSGRSRSRSRSTGSNRFKTGPPIPFRKRRDGDWLCPNCGNNNFYNRKVCNKCPTLRSPPRSTDRYPRHMYAVMEKASSQTLPRQSSSSPPRDSSKAGQSEEREQVEKDKDNSSRAGQSEEREQVDKDKDNSSKAGQSEEREQNEKDKDQAMPEKEEVSSSSLDKPLEALGLLEECKKNSID